MGIDGGRGGRRSILRFGFLFVARVSLCLSCSCVHSHSNEVTYGLGHSCFVAFPQNACKMGPREAKHMRLIWIASTSLALALAVAPAAILGLWMTTASTAQQDDSIAKALQELRSSRDSIRSDAKTRLLLAGSEAVRPVMALLSDLLKRAGNRVPIQQETGRPLLSGFQDGSEHPDTWRIINDCCDVLGALRDARAVRLLIQVVEVRCTREMVSFGRRPNEISAIALIGKPAEAALIEELKTAQQRAASLVGLRTAEGDDRILWLQERRVYESTVFELQMQMSDALSRVGDSGTIEALEALLRSDGDYGRKWRVIVEGTIARIASRSGLLIHR